MTTTPLHSPASGHIGLLGHRLHLPTASGRGGAAGWTGLLARLGRSFAAAQRRRRIAATVRSLQRLDDRMLADIGLSRDQIRDWAIAAEDGETTRSR